ncbi:hypothetical protein [Nocardia exalbida]|uniref:hypothetical protein n=1 Tax=Nocardia exalbida TaxID=290231 RepID=UPI0002F88285|nr:hypothetical protein [Nocardia exalbida]
MGDRAPDAKLLNAAEGAQRLFDLFSGPHSTAIAYGRAAVAELAALTWPSAGAGLKKVAINGGEQVDADVVLADITDSFARIYGLADSALLLIRPDGYIGSIATTGMARVTMAHAAAMTPAVSDRQRC